MTRTQPESTVDRSPRAHRRATLCITTYLRPVGLSEALEAVAALRVPADWDLEVVVVDNDAAGSARPVVEDAVRRGMNGRYVIEPRRGLSHVRNRGCAEAAAADWLLFLDDDEAPNVDWLERIDAAQRRSDADVTLGPSVPVYEIAPPTWIVEGDYFERERFPTGTAIPYWHARTSGVLIRRVAS
jgi:succinoglycan biosynthesis protein ExoM